MHRLMLCLNIIVFSTTFIMGDNVFVNAFLLQCAELMFIVLYILLLRQFPPIFDIFKNNSFIAFTIILWAASMSYSFYNSPLLLSERILAFARYLQSLTHMITFVFVWDFLRRYQPDLKLLFYLIPIASVLIMGAFFIDWFTVADFVEKEWVMDNWLKHPPFNSNIRHTGYQLTAALSIILVHYIKKPTLKVIEVATFVIFVVLWSFLFWLGGRGAIISTLSTVWIVWLVLFLRKQNHRYFLLVTVAAAVSGVFLAEWFAIFSWNGLLSNTLKSVEAKSLNQLSANRIDIWYTAWTSVKGYLAFGLGPQAYYFMPNRIFGVQPHNVFLQFLLEWGGVGSTLFCILLIKGFWHGMKLHIIENTQDLCISAIAAGAIITSLSIHALVDGTYYHPQPSLYLAIAFAIWVIPKRAQLQARDQS